MGSMGESEVANHPYHKFLVSAEGGSAVGVGVYYFEIKDGLDAPDCWGKPPIFLNLFFSHLTQGQVLLFSFLHPK